MAEQDKVARDARLPHESYELDQVVTWKPHLISDKDQPGKTEPRKKAKELQRMRGIYDERNFHTKAE
ncbi:hypothetical protein RvY_13904 [Ramazzottius varieornatus]|uniref:Uncharacterized protein n=1 Tax=Ramazzottius varieornatus TaxID=947166 RepID=A0A1D1VUN6_RAMVA|nr:hypothetical protein RvY_13904 [Ramazzottius varieornatus]